MKNKLLSVLLTLTMVFTVTIPTFAAEEQSLIPKSIEAREQSVMDVLEGLLNKEDPEMEMKTGTIKLDETKNVNVTADVSVRMYTLKLSSDKNVNLSYKSNALLLEVAMVDDSDAIWTDTFINESLNKEVSGNVDLKLKKGEYTLMVTSTKGDYSISPTTKSETLKTMTPFTVKKVLPGATSISGTGVAGAKVTVITSQYKQYNTTVKSDGTYKVTVPKQAEDDAVIIKIEKAGYGAKVKTEFIEKYYFKTFTVNTVKTTSTTVTGKGQSGATVKAYVGKKQIGKSTVKSNGTYSIKIAKQAAGKEITVKMSKTNYYTDEEYTTVKKVFTSKLTVNSLKSTSTYVTGKGAKGATVKAYVGNKQIGKATVKSNGTYSIKIPKQAKKKVVTVKMSKSGYATVSKSVTVK